MTTEVTAAQVAQAAVASLRSEAQSHKRASSHHRREAQRIMAARQALIDNCLAAGIEIEEPEASSHGQ